MKKYLILLIAGLLFAWIASPANVLAQTGTPPPSGEVSGRIINQNQGVVVTESLEVMLHIWDQNDAAINMLHAQSMPDGTFRFTGVALQPQYFYAVMATFDGVTYQSKALSPTDGSDRLELDVPVYETTTDTSAIQVEQLHILFNFAEDGLETTEIYLLSNAGKRTVKDAVKLDDGTPATLRYPLPSDADYIFFQPDEGDRFIKFPGGFADTFPILPGEQVDQHAVKYMVPYSQGQTYSYTAPLNIKAMNFLLQENAGVLLKGDGLAGPEPVTLDNGVSYVIYSYSDVHAGQTISVTFSGKPALGAKSQPDNLTLPLALGGGLLGLVTIGAGLWWWRKPGDDMDEDEEPDSQSDETALDKLIGEIARLDEAHERGKLDEREYRRERTQLRREAKKMLDRQEQRL